MVQVIGQQYLKRATRALHRGVKKASSMQARQRSLEAAVFRLSKESKHSDKSCSATHKPNKVQHTNEGHQYPAIKNHRIL